MSSERQLDNTDNPWWGEHIHRYEEAIRILGTTGQVMDIACGTGFGSYLLAKHGFKVVGGDISKEAIEHCKEKYQMPGLTFEVTDGTNIHYPTASFDAVISFETIEHTTGFMKMIEEFKRITKPGGKVILSTPNFPVNSPSGVVTNPYHTQEWAYDEFKKILQTHFEDFTIYGQRYTRYQDEKGFSMKLGRITELILYQRGIRKLPLNVQNSIMKSLTGKPMYPQANDYQMVSDIAQIKQCKTFFAICNV